MFVVNGGTKVEVVLVSPEVGRAVGSVSLVVFSSGFENVITGENVLPPVFVPGLGIVIGSDVVGGGVVSRLVNTGWVSSYNRLLAPN